MEKKTREQIKEYIGFLLNKLEFEKDIDRGIAMSLLLLKVYVRGFEHKEFPLELTAEPKDIPEPYFTTIGQLAVLLENEPMESEIRGYLYKNIERQLKNLMYLLLPYNL